MSQLPPPNTPLNQHSLPALESWLDELGASKSTTDPCVWVWSMPQWSAEIKMDVDELQVTWHQDGNLRHCHFPYGLSRLDVQSAIVEGP